MSRFRTWLAQRRVPQPWPKGAVACPKCGRALAGATRPSLKPSHVVPRPMVLAPTDHDLIWRCAVDGEIGRGLRAAPIDLEELTALTVKIASACDAAGEPGWGAMLRAAAERDEQREIHVGHALALFRRRGPMGDRGPVPVDDTALRQLILDVVTLWPPMA